jgi:hypothetical protein
MGTILDGYKPMTRESYDDLHSRSTFFVCIKKRHLMDVHDFIYSEISLL